LGMKAGKGQKEGGKRQYNMFHKRSVFMIRPTAASTSS